MNERVPGEPIGEVLAGLKIPALQEGEVPTGLLALVKVRDADGDEGWSVRVTSNLSDDEVLGTLVSYVEHLKLEAAAGWDDGDPTQASD